MSDDEYISRMETAVFNANIVIRKLQEENSSLKERLKEYEAAPEAETLSYVI